MKKSHNCCLRKVPMWICRIKLEKRQLNEPVKEVCVCTNKWTLFEIFNDKCIITDHQEVATLLFDNGADESEDE